MSFSNLSEKMNNFDLEAYINNVTDSDIENTLRKTRLDEYDFLNLISDRADNYLEQIAEKAQDVSIQNFGRTILLYIPLYISNYCTNRCLYCGFNQQNEIERSKLSYDEIEVNAKQISKTGMKHILFLTGEDRNQTSIDYLLETTEILKKYFSSISIEVFPMDLDEYSSLQQAGVDGLTIYQEVYDPEVYQRVHIAGKKRDYNYRLDAPERGAQAGFRSINIGPLFGLADPKKEAFMTAMHVNYLQNKYLDTEFSISLPRLNEAEGGYKADYILNDRMMVKFILAFRLFLPRAGITISTRESAAFRDNLIPLGVTKMSAGSVTTVGGYTSSESETPQFEISDDREVVEIVKAIRFSGYQAVYKDWDIL